MEFPRQHARTQRFTLGVPRTITVAPDGSRVLFCRSGGGTDPVNRLWSFDVATGTDRLIADPAELLATDNAHLPAAERARRERARESGAGIVGYATDHTFTAAVFALAGRIYRADLTTGDVAGLPAVPGAFDPRPDPAAERVAYVADGRLRVTGLGHDDRLLAGEDDPDIAWGMAEFIAAEEMGRTRGFWWSPRGDRLLAARVDVSGVLRWHIGAPIDPAQTPAVIRYPAAGTANARVELAMVDLEGGRTTVPWDTAEFEYLAAVSWTPDGDPLIAVQSRDQRTMAVLDIDPVTGQSTQRHRWSDDSWVELVPGAPRRWGTRLLTVEDQGPARRLCVDGEAVTPDHLQIRQVVSADERGVVVLGTSDPTELQVLRIDEGGTIEPLTDTPGVHTAVCGGDTLVVSSASLDHDGTTTSVRHPGVDAATITSHGETPVSRPDVQLLQAGERAIRTAVLWPTAPPGAPTNHEPLPVLLDPYGGPHALRVQQARGAYGVSQWFADNGYCVIVADGRGTPARGPAWERAVRGDLAGPVLDDQIAALVAVDREHPGRLDLGRVGIRGWSFGGYLAALAVLARPDIFHAAVAGAPVTDWRLYDTHYTERYLGHPDTHPDNYERTDLTRRAAQLERPLLLIHGLADDNVVAAHTLELSRALLEAGRPHRVIPLSGVTHMTPQETVAENLLLLQLAFLDEHLRS